MTDKPFLKIDNQCIAIDRIVSAEFLPVSTLFKVNDFVLFNDLAAQSEAFKYQVEAEEFKAPVLSIEYINSSGGRDTIRRWGASAKEIWDYFMNNLSVP